ncbi:MAG: diaminopimelate decarboxylase [Cardiobacteriaceae bacterium]|nr:diaminopimelate decarboxylase [Cardiobacteriaceae bacterium]
MSHPWQSFAQSADGWRFEGVAAEDLVAQFGTPLYVYSLAAVRRHVDAYHQHDFPEKAKLHYAVKANGNLALLAEMARLGMGFDIVSGGELARVLAAGGAAENIVFSGVAKTDAEIDAALAAGIGCFNVESREELQILAARAQALGTTAPVALRVNPDVDANTHPYISTGLKDNKFGVAIEEAEALYHQALALPALRVRGISCHIGSQIVNLDPFAKAMDSVLALADRLLAQGVPLEFLDMGGGLGVANSEDMAVATPGELVAMLFAKLGTRPLALHLQPGRSIVANAGALLTQIVLVKTQGGKRFIMLDAGMNDYIRPALYQVRPAMRNLSRAHNNTHADIVGPVCETGDTFARDYPLDGVRGDLVAIAGTGAYGMAMASTYNSRPLPAEVLVDQGSARLIRQRQRVEDIWQQEIASP